MKIRIKFRKYGVMKFIGHLDMMRYFQKAIRRAQIPIAYTEGFSPHQILSFAAPLGVGLCSDGEYFDIQCRETPQKNAQELRDDLNRQMVEGVEIVSVVALPEDAGNAMASVAAARYRVRFREGAEPDTDWVSQIESFYQQLTIPVKKQTKRQIVELDLKPAIYALSVSESGGSPALDMLVDASSAGNIRPALVVQALCAYCGVPFPGEEALLITRLETYGRKETPDGGSRLLPLEAFGEAF